MRPLPFLSCQTFLPRDFTEQCRVFVAHARRGPPSVVAVAALFKLGDRTVSQSEFLADFLRGAVIGPPVNDDVAALAAIEFGIWVTSPGLGFVIASTANYAIDRICKYARSTAEARREARDPPAEAICFALRERGAKIRYVTEEENFLARRTQQIADKALRLGLAADWRSRKP
jgi:hypothetical protein